jgi:cytochrome c-type protein NapB
VPEPGGDAAQRRVLELLAAAVVAIAVIGVITGISPEEYEAKRPPARVRAPAGEVPPARSHAELERNPWGGGPVASGWTEGVAVARAAAVERPEQGWSVAEAVAARTVRRAYDGAPPVVPHPVRPGGAPECVACHLDGFALGARRASAIPHQTFASCTQCHVSTAASLAVLDSGGSPTPGAMSTWRGLESSEGGPTAYEGAPPAVPHSTWMRERCESCHGPDGRVAMRTPHLERRSCLQCHPAISERITIGSR